MNVWLPMLAIKFYHISRINKCTETNEELLRNLLKLGKALTQHYRSAVCGESIDYWHGRLGFDSRLGQTKDYKNWYSQLFCLTFRIERDSMKAPPCVVDVWAVWPKGPFPVSWPRQLWIKCKYNYTSNCSMTNLPISISYRLRIFKSADSYLKVLFSANIVA